MKALPADVAEYHRTQEYSDETVPPSFLEATHSTRAGVWCRVQIVEGALDYRVLEPNTVDHVLTPAAPGIVEPEVRHTFALRGPVRFYIEFHRDPALGEDGDATA